MPFRVQLLNNNYGPLTIDDIDPIGISKIKQIINRSDKQDGIVYNIAFNLQFAKKARSYIKNVYENYGIEAIIFVTIFQLNENTRKYELYYPGKLKLPTYEIDEILNEASLEQSGFEIKVTQQMDADVDLATLVSRGNVALESTPEVLIPFHAKKILENYEASAEDSNEFQQLSTVAFEIPGTPFGGSSYREAVLYGQINNSDAEINDVEDTFSLPFGWSLIEGNLGIGDAIGTAPDYIAFLTAHKSPRNPVHIAKFNSVIDLELSMRLRHEMHVTNTGGDVDICGSGALGRTEVYAWFEIRDLDNNIKELTNLGKWDDMEDCGGNDRESDYLTLTLSRPDLILNAGDKVYWYVTYRITGEYDRPVLDGHLDHDFNIQADKANTWITITSESEFLGNGAPVPCVMIHEALKKNLQFITDQEDCFHSDFFGRTDIGYDEDGEGSLMALTSGDRIRLRDKSLFVNLSDLLGSLNSIWCLGMGVETIEGTSKVRIEKKEHFYDKDTMILRLGKVAKLKKSVNMKYYYNQMEFAYPKMDQGQVNGSDEFNTTRRFLFPLIQPTAKLILKSVYRAAGYEIEALRRQANETTDNNADSPNFFICVRRDGDDFVTEKNEDFPGASGIFSPETAYNLRISPSQNLRRWVRVISSNVIRQINKLFTFSYGEGNYTCTIGAQAENANIDVTGVVPLYDPEDYDFEYYLSNDEVQLIKESPYGFIRFEDEFGNEKDGFILNIEHEAESGLGQFKLLKVHR